MSDAVPVVSIITPAFQAQEFLQETIDSVLAQTFREWEMLIIIDAASKDATRSVAESASRKDSRVRVIDGGLGVTENRNIGIKQARGRYVAFLDADDLWLPAKLDKQISFMRSNGAALSFTSYRRFVDAAERPGRLIEAPSKVSYQDILKHNSIGCLTAIFDREQTGLVEMKSLVQEDLSLWFQILRRGLSAFGLKDDLARYRVSASSRSSNKFNMAKQRWQLFRNHENLSVLESGYYFAWYAFESLRKHSRH